MTREADIRAATIREIATMARARAERLVDDANASDVMDSFADDIEAMASAPVEVGHGHSA